MNAEAERTKYVPRVIILVPNAQDLRRPAGWRAGCSAVGMPAKAIRSGHWLGDLLLLEGKAFKTQDSILSEEDEVP